jgi:hypothetical protein
MGILRGNQHMWAWFQCRTSPKDICDVTIWPIHRVLLFIELCGANRPCIWPTSVLQKWACPMTKQFPVCWTSLARSDPSSLRVINIFGPYCLAAVLGATSRGSFRSEPECNIFPTGLYYLCFRLRAKHELTLLCLKSFKHGLI